MRESGFLRMRPWDCFRHTGQIDIVQPMTSSNAPSRKRRKLPDEVREKLCDNLVRYSINTWPCRTRWTRACVSWMRARRLTGRHFLRAESQVWRLGLSPPNAPDAIFRNFWPILLPTIRPRHDPCRAGSTSLYGCWPPDRSLVKVQGCEIRLCGA